MPKLQRENYTNVDEIKKGKPPFVCGGEVEGKKLLALPFTNQLGRYPICVGRPGLCRPRRTAPPQTGDKEE
jgi:hypothetical protein